MSTEYPDDFQRGLHFSDFVSEPKRMLLPIKGFEDKPLVSLEKAVEPLHSLVNDIGQMVWIAKENCQKPENCLSQDESASIMLYSMEWKPHESSFYYILNNVLRSQNRQELIPWFLYLRLVIHALSKLPASSPKIVYRGIRKDMSSEFSKGQKFIWWGFSSCTTSIEVLNNFLGQNGARTIFNIECQSGKSIGRHSFYEKEDEFLIYPAQQFEVISSYNAGNQLHIIHIKETSPPWPLFPKPAQVANDPISSYENQQLVNRILQFRLLSFIDLEYQNLIDDDMNIIAREAIIKKKCRQLRLQGQRITSNGVSILAKTLQNNETLEILDLSKNRVCDTGVADSAQVLALNNSALKTLSIRSASVTDVGIQHLAEMLKTNTVLTGLELSENQISDRGVELLANSLTRHNQSLIWLSLSFNWLVSDLSIDFLVRMLEQNVSLKEWYISDCNLTENGKSKLRQTEKSNVGFRLRV
ncbi:unnamed protein product [Rotaria sp. Silwood2]|nr:unnamed protein product [Rotaria sp. Silwood2]